MNLIQMRLLHYDELLAAARGDIPADTLIHGGKILNVMTGEILEGDIAIHKGFIVAMFARNTQARQKINASGKIALPAFIDPHIIARSCPLPFSHCPQRRGRRSPTGASGTRTERPWFLSFPGRNAKASGPLTAFACCTTWPSR